MSIERIWDDISFKIIFQEEGTEYKIKLTPDFRVNALEIGSQTFEWTDFEGTRFMLDNHDILVVVKGLHRTSFESVKFIVDNQPVYYEIPEKMTISRDDSGEIARTYEGNDPGELVITAEEAEILASPFVPETSVASFPGLLDTGWIRNILKSVTIY